MITGLSSTHLSRLGRSSALSISTSVHLFLATECLGLRIAQSTIDPCFALVTDPQQMTARLSPDLNVALTNCQLIAISQSTLSESLSSTILQCYP
ncbi:hypothetical protein BJX61DRAFT_23993 [Aspergillus egyptiacus]|nr:hypothetical protein BJX61DRAFT_23993 [Aspergillus egyptiacus]